MTAEINTNVAQLAESQIRQIMELGHRMEGVIPLWFGEGDEPTPDFIKQAAGFLGRIHHIGNFRLKGKSDLVFLSNL